MEKKELLKELEKKFGESKKELNFKPSFEELENEFALNDFILSSDFVSENFSRQLCSRIVEHYREWHGYLNNLLLPNPSYYAGQTESKLLNSEDDRQKIWTLIKISMKFSSMHSLLALKHDKKLETDFINESYSSWINLFKPGLIYVMAKLNEGWKKE